MICDIGTVMAGRTGAAFTAQLRAMEVSEEIEDVFVAPDPFHPRRHPSDGVDSSFQGGPHPLA